MQHRWTRNQAKICIKLSGASHQQVIDCAPCSICQRPMADRRSVDDTARLQFAASSLRDVCMRVAQFSGFWELSRRQGNGCGAGHRYIVMHCQLDIQDAASGLGSGHPIPMPFGLHSSLTSKQVRSSLYIDVQLVHRCPTIRTLLQRTSE